MFACAVERLSSHGVIQMTGGWRMADVGQVFKCEVCGNVVEVIEAGTNRMLKCCDQAMTVVK